MPEGVDEVLGIWHWGNTAEAFAWDNGALAVTALADGQERYRFASRTDGTFVGVSGYHHGETLRVVRNEDGSINHLVCATFVYTRTPYDPRAPIPN